MPMLYRIVVIPLNRILVETTMKKIFASLALAMFISTPAIAVVYHGNPESKVFHHPDCQHYASPKATEKFSSKEQAIKAKYKPCKLCLDEKGGKSDSHVYHGNPESKIFHHPDCQHYTSPKATERFTSKEQALKANYKPCKLCFVEKNGKIESKNQIRARENQNPPVEKKTKSNFFNW